MPIFVRKERHKFFKRNNRHFPGDKHYFEKKSTDIFSGIMGCSRLGINKKIRTFVSVEK